MSCHGCVWPFLCRYESDRGRRLFHVSCKRRYVSPEQHSCFSNTRGQSTGCKAAKGSVGAQASTCCSRFDLHLSDRPEEPLGKELWCKSRASFVHLLCVRRAFVRRLSRVCVVRLSGASPVSVSCVRRLSSVCVGIYYLCNHSMLTVTSR